MMTQLMVAIGVPSSSSAVAESALRPPFFEVAVSSIVLLEEPPAKENVADVIYLYDYYLSDFPDAGDPSVDWTSLQDNITGTVTQQQLETALRNLQRLKK